MKCSGSPDGASGYRRKVERSEVEVDIRFRSCFRIGEACLVQEFGLMKSDVT